MSGLYARAGGVLLVLLVLVAGLYGSYRHGVKASDLEWQAKWAEQVKTQAEARATAQAEHRTEEQRRQTAINQVANDARQEQAAAINDASRADASGDRLRVEARKLASTASCSSIDSGTAERGKTATRAAMVLSDLLSRADERAGELARAYDRARIAGLACERAYQSLSP